MPRAVSYTHLDVYKRQEVSRATTIIMPEPMRNMEGVEAESRREVIKY